MIAKITLNKSYIYGNERVRVIEVRKAYPKLGLGQRVYVQYQDGSTRMFFGSHFRDTAEYLPKD